VFKLLRLTLLLVLFTGGIAAPAAAALILKSYDSDTPTPETIGGYAMSDFAFTRVNGRSSVSSVLSPSGDSLNFVDAANNVLSLTHNSANRVGWWRNGEANDYNVFTTDENLITILLPENTFAFSFNVGAKFRNRGDNAWLLATETIGPGISNKYRFNVGKFNTPGFGIYAANNGGTCSALSSVTIEPDYWGVGNFSINQGSCGPASSSSVPEPSSIVLLLMGAMGFGLVRWKLSSTDFTA